VTPTLSEAVSSAQLVDMMQDARARTHEMLSGLDAEQLMGPYSPIVNPLRWEVGHVAYFYEWFTLMEMYGRDSILGNKRAAELYDSIAVTHDTRWDLPLLTMEETLQYMQDVQDKLAERLPDGLASEQDSFMYQFAVFHEDMHTEAYLWARQTLAYSAPTLAIAADVSAERAAGAYPGYVEVPGGTFRMGAEKSAPFLFDNEKWAHEVDVRPFEIAKAPVTNAEFAAFIVDGGYDREEWWSPEGWKWRRSDDGLGSPGHPVYWVPDGPGKWLMRRFDQTIPLPANEPVIHVTWYEADAYCKWAGMRLPSELEWEVAALGEPGGGGTLAQTKRRYPWGDTLPDPTRANLDGRGLGAIDVAALPAGDSAFGCRQMCGNVWEWTSTTFGGYPGFSHDAYKEYSTMLFGDTKVLRGGAWTTRGRMIHGTYRNYFGPERWNVFSGFRTCRI
jgi:gamma-glutamyl hercynylcysteine S-oxide synthase